MTPPPPLTRRDFLCAGLASGTAVLGCAGAPRTAGPREAGRLRTDLCDLLGIEYPTVQAGMAPVAGPDLAAAVSEAGGLGVLGVATTPADEGRRRIRRVRGRPNKPFGVNLVLHSEVWPPVDTAGCPDPVVRAVQTVLNRFRARLDLPATFDRPATRPNDV